MTDTDVMNTLAGLAPRSPLALIRGGKPVTRENAQASFRALFEPAEPGAVALQERFAIASFVAGLHAQDDVTAFYTAGLLRTMPAQEFLAALSAEVDRGRTAGPYGAYPKGPLTVENVPGLFYQVDATNRSVLGTRLSAALAHVHMLVFHPRDASPASLQALHNAGWSKNDIVTLSQLVAFLAFQIRAVAGLRALASPKRREPTLTENVITHPENDEPTEFTLAMLDWLPWLAPPAEDALTERQRASLVDPARSRSAYFRLLASDPDILEARTRTDKDIFYNTASGLPRAERELAAAATSRHNGCIYCASVHARHATTYSKRREDVQRLLDVGVKADLGERWNAIVAAAVALTATPIVFGSSHVMQLRAVGLYDAEIVDVINASAFFNWANRLMLSLGEPCVTADH